MSQTKIESLCHQKVAQMCLAIKEVGMSWFLTGSQKRSMKSVVGALEEDTGSVEIPPGHKVKRCSYWVPNLVVPVDSASDGDRGGLVRSLRSSK